MIWSHWRMQVVILWLGGCIGSLIKDKPFSLAESIYSDDVVVEGQAIPLRDPHEAHPHHHHNVHHHHSSASQMKFLHSSSKKTNVHSSSSSSSSSPSNSIFNSPGASTYSQQNPSDNQNQEEEDYGENYLEEVVSPRDGVVSSGGDILIQEKLRSTKGTSSSSSSSSSSSGGIGVGGGGSQDSQDHYHSQTSHHQRHQHGHNGSENGGGGGGDGDTPAHNHQQQQLVPPQPREQQEKLLLQQLMRGYERDVRPVRNASHSVVVKVGITLTQIFDMDEKNQVLTTNVWLDQEWNDELLRWDPVDFGGLEVIRIPCERIWLPDIVLYNNADDYTRGYMPSRAMVKFDGNVFWPPPTKFRSTCAVDVTYFPFDDQTCQLKLGSWTYNGDQVDITNRTAAIDLDNYVVNGEWDLLQADIKRNVVVYPCCPEQFPDVTITLVIRRKTLYYIYNIVLPCMMLSALTLLVFCLPPDSGEKIALGITVLLAFSVFMLAISEALPETSESIPLIGIYLTAVMAITSISVIVTVVVLNLHYLGPRVRPVPAWLKCLLPEDDVNFIRQKSMLIPASHREPRSGSLKRGHVYLPSTPKGSGGGGDTTSACADETIKDVRDQLAAEDGVNNDKTSATGNYSTNHSRARSRVGGGSTPTTSHLDASASMSAATAAAVMAVAHANRSGGGGGGGSGPAPPSSFVYSRVKSDKQQSDSIPPSMCEDLVTAVRYLMSIQEQVESQNVLVAEWRLVAQAVDRILFWIFSVMTIVSSMMLLLILPLYKRSTYYGPSVAGDNLSEEVQNGTEAFA